jgi:hypothetical protein
MSFIKQELDRRYQVILLDIKAKRVDTNLLKDINKIKDVLNNDMKLNILDLLNDYCLQKDEMLFYNIVKKLFT